MALTTSQLLGLIIVVVIVILVVLAVVNPSLMFGNWGNQLWSFNDFCVVWNSQKYQPGLNGEITMTYQKDEGETETITYNVNEYCSGALGKYPSNLTDNDIENCRDLCRR